MNLGIWAQVDSTVRNLCPFVTTVFLVMLNVLPLPIPFAGAISPFLVLAAVYYWAIFRPDLLPPAAVFVVGMLYDALGGGPFGLGTLFLLVAHTIVIRQRRFFHGKSFFVMWWGFIFVATGFALANWAAVFVMAGQLVAPAPGAARLLLTIAFYPCLTWLLLRIHRAFLSPA
jgi:rod shape-determining protein MreD